MPLTTGQVLISRYRIVNLLGQGGFGAVYRVWDTSLGCPCALKENLGSSPDAQKQFRQEAILLSNLIHPNLPRVTDHFFVPAQGQYLVMDFVEGEDLQKKVERNAGPLPVLQVLPWIEQICDALTYLHTRVPAVIHRDIKPANIRITVDAANPLGNAVLVDFGIAKVYDPSLKTTVGARALTPGYSPLEQYGHGKTDSRTDLYALGATLYTVLTAQVPVDSLQRQMGKPLLAPCTLNQAIPPDMENVILHAMQIDPVQRFATAAEFKAALIKSLPAGVIHPGPGQPVLKTSPPPVKLQVGMVQPVLPGAAQGVSIPSFLGAANSVPRAIAGQYPVVPASLAPPAPPRRSLKTWLGIGGFALVGLVLLYIIWVSFIQNLITEAGATATRSMAIRLTAIAFVPTEAEASPALQLQVTDTPTPNLTFTPVLSISPSPGSTTLPPTSAPTQTATQGSWYPCAGTYASRLHIGNLAYVSNDPPQRNRVRSQPDINAQILGYIEPGTEVEIMAGPRCANAMIWWKVNVPSSGLAGWTSEGDQQKYWLVPKS